MKFVIAPDSFKGSLSAQEVADSLEQGIKKVFGEATVVKVPMADGGEGTVQSLVDGTSGEIIKVKVKDPLMREIDSFYGILGDGKTAVIEMAAASGLPLLSKEERNPIIATTYGTGELIKHALSRGCRNIIIGIGGSATNDGGAGMVQALGVRLTDENGKELSFGGGELHKLHKIDISGIDFRIRECTITVACDVDNPLCGPKGAAYVFGSQKGADKKTIEILDKNLINYAKVIKNDLNIDILDVPGAGAAGGLGGALIAFLNAKLKRGIDIVIDATGLEDKIKDADLVITGEGMIDFQTAFGKTPFGVAKVAKKYGIPVIAIAGGIGREAETLYEKGFDSIFSIVEGPISLEEAMANGKPLLKKASERIMRLLKISILK
ncbi:MAG TPA: glycerate kinase [Clostridium sp.]|uniref:glycerate kinase n=1 Tax=Clostridium sp. TaxID=1506 RepID=UPI002F91E1B8